MHSFPTRRSADLALKLGLGRGLGLGLGHSIHSIGSVHEATALHRHIHRCAHSGHPTKYLELLCSLDDPQLGAEAAGLWLAPGHSDTHGATKNVPTPPKQREYAILRLLLVPQS